MQEQKDTLPEEEKDIMNETETPAEEEIKVEEENQQPEREPQEITILDTELEALKAELKDAKEKYVRLLAESENQRKRIHKERGELTKYAVEKVIAEFLQPLDQFAKALSFKDHMTDEVRNWATGFEMILNQFRDVLLDQGITEFESVGKPFDPHFHEAVETEETEEYPDGTVLSEFVRGYRMGERVIRPARVKVAKAPKPELATEGEEKEEETNNKSS